MPIYWNKPSGKWSRALLLLRRRWEIGEETMHISPGFVPIPRKQPPVYIIDDIHAHDTIPPEMKVAVNKILKRTRRP